MARTACLSIENDQLKAENAALRSELEEQHQESRNEVIMLRGQLKEAYSLMADHLDHHASPHSYAGLWTWRHEITQRP